MAECGLQSWRDVSPSPEFILGASQFNPRPFLNDSRRHPHPRHPSFWTHAFALSCPIFSNQRPILNSGHDESARENRSCCTGRWPPAGKLQRALASGASQPSPDLTQGLYRNQSELAKFTTAQLPESMSNSDQGDPRSDLWFLHSIFCRKMQRLSAMSHQRHQPQFSKDHGPPLWFLEKILKSRDAQAFQPAIESQEPLTKVASSEDIHHYLKPSPFAPTSWNRDGSTVGLPWATQFWHLLMEEKAPPFLRNPGITSKAQLVRASLFSESLRICGTWSSKESAWIWKSRVFPWKWSIRIRMMHCPYRQFAAR